MIADPGTPDLAFLLDVDNTLLDNDALKVEIGRRIERLVGAQLASRFWTLYEAVREERDVVDYPRTVDRFLAENGSAVTPEALRDVFATLRFSAFLYPGALAAIRYLHTLGTVVILSDGDQVFQPEKIRQSGLADAVGGNVLIYVHKELELPQVFARYPARHYVMVDDKPRILAALEDDRPSFITTVFVLQGHYATEGKYQPSPDFVIRQIADLTGLSKEQFLTGQTSGDAGRNEAFGNAP